MGAEIYFGELEEVEKEAAVAFLTKFQEPDLTHIKQIIAAVGHAANRYLIHGNLHSASNYFKRRDRTYGYPFFSLFAVTKDLSSFASDEIALILATNYHQDGHIPMPYEPRPDYGDHLDIVHLALRQTLPETDIALEGLLPNEVNIATTGGKAMISITPKNGQEIEFFYVRSIGRNGDEENLFFSEEEFIEMDFQPIRGVPLERLILYRKTGHVTPPKLHW